MHDTRGARLPPEGRICEESRVSWKRACPLSILYTLEYICKYSLYPMPLTSPDIAKDAVSAPHNHSGRNTPHTGTRTWSSLVTTWECCMCTSVDLCLKNEPVPQNEPQNQAKSQKQKQRQSKNKLVSCPNQGPYLLDRERGDTTGAKLIWLENSWWVGPAMGANHPYHNI